MKFLRLALRNLARNKRRTALTILSIAVSLFIFAALMSLPAVVHEIMRDRANSLRLISHSKGGYFYPLPEAYRTRIEAVPHVEVVVGENIFMGTYRDLNDRFPAPRSIPTTSRRCSRTSGSVARRPQRSGRTRTAGLVGAMLMRAIDGAWATRFSCAGPCTRSRFNSRSSVRSPAISTRPRRSCSGATSSKRRSDIWATSTSSG